MHSSIFQDVLGVIEHGSLLTHLAWKRASECHFIKIGGQYAKSFPLARSVTSANWVLAVPYF